MDKEGIVRDIVTAFKSQGKDISEEQAEIAYDSYILSGEDKSYFDYPSFKGIVKKLNDYIPENRSEVNYYGKR